MRRRTRCKSCSVEGEGRLSDLMIRLECDDDVAVLVSTPSLPLVAV